MSVKLTSYSHGAGCGCKLSPAVLQEILSGAEVKTFEQLLVGNETKDDAAVYDLDGKTSIISTTDFFMPIVDDPHDFGAIAATNAISDIYAMGGTPIMAIAILGWPVNKLSTEIANTVLAGGRSVCHAAGIPLAGGHSIDAPEPIFGLAVTGKVATASIKKNNLAKSGDLIYLSKPLGIGLITTAQKKGIAKENDLQLAKKAMLTLNQLGADVSTLDYVHAMTDVTGFGLGGHLVEVLEASHCSARISYHKIPTFPFISTYLDAGTSPGGTQRNWESYGQKIILDTQDQDHRLIADPQTSGGLLITVDPAYQQDFENFTDKLGYDLTPLGTIEEEQTYRLRVSE